MKRLVLYNFQSPGDIVMLTAAVRDLQMQHPGRFEIDVRTSCPDFWSNNPFLTPLDEKNPEIEEIYCHYPLVHRSNHEPWHFIHGFQRFLSDHLKVNFTPSAFKGDIHLSKREREDRSEIQKILGADVPFWIVVAGGKTDFTIKWWSHPRFQAVVDHFLGRLLFVQVGESGHEHPALEGVCDLRGKTDLRQLVQLVHHAQGVLCPVTLLMHLAAAVETRPGTPKNRACVVVAGGREPSHWEAYPHHQFLHTNGMLPCCEEGGCWKARTFPLHDVDEKDHPMNLCADVVLEGQGRGDIPRMATAYPAEEWVKLIPECMNMIRTEDVIARIELYFRGGQLKYLSSEQANTVEKYLQRCRSENGLHKAESMAFQERSIT